ncbi:MAG TPA: helix-turn-helix domain-containing protein [Accumulibacter sp.]|uniref:helix-turn-helix domain-containing protein n=1 Tax=Accumulibacter sp. TaxID=2053492 RepID=UPI0028784C2B|nr:helix-turn-helix domain-containing protein [Accumulibacter sp.]MDS4055931.1 helix-turn-helix domain-containing protein [Accumulibacter sp.]HMV06795.1 helix-turn-helix domain-containing protein [Accumulibacter sp.]HMW65161.1 helix-turn-helix domain-containing protein [Accumulibacter sp.]HMW81909.1 helix-turn-helix domain-containing protein [Accumulibacter sp.]HMX70035.1 helix-turn-helix domain-containing protein [Accumulibacter sp.]
MKLSLEQAAARLGKSERQVRYLIMNGRLPAEKVAGRWLIDSAALPLSPGQQSAIERKERQLRAAVEDGLGLSEANERAPRYSVRDLKAFQLAQPVHGKALALLGADHPATAALRSVLGALTRGCHRFDYGEKAEAYRFARDATSEAIVELLLCGRSETDELVALLEQELMAALAGLLRRLDHKRRR